MARRAAFRAQSTAWLAALTTLTTLLYAISFGTEQLGGIITSYLMQICASADIMANSLTVAWFCGLIGSGCNEDVESQLATAGDLARRRVLQLAEKEEEASRKAN